jgi:hypothetical protein
VRVLNNDVVQVLNVTSDVIEEVAGAEPQELERRERLYRALPEGVLEPGGRVTGFLYFEDIDVGKDDKATFVTDLVNASTGQTVGAIRSHWRSTEVLPCG